ncbi:MAG: S-layer homology domain-containing protein [Evtepia sp.]|nr:S-layer homology domain-containing protein [Evtepia sp.]
MSRLKKGLALVLTLCMMLSLVPVITPSAKATDEGDFTRIFHLDAGRKYFSVDQIKALIDTLKANNYTHMELAVGNDGLRFLLDNMSVTANDTTYASDAVKAGIQAGNKTYYDAGTYNELTQTEMDTIISYANEKGIGIIPLINTPGHMDAILDCMEGLDISSPAYNNSTRTVDVTNTAAVNFTLALVNKYIQYFAGKGCEFFNMGCDEYANDVSNSGFAGLISSGKYGNFITYVNNMAAQVEAAGMTPMAFNDGIYYNSNISSGTFDTKIAIAYWTSGWGGYSPAPASFLAEKGHTIISTNDAWYYVLGRQAGNSSGYTIATAQNGVQNTACTDIPGDNDPTAAGCMICLWCDTPSASYSSTEVSNVTGLISTFATNNPTYFAADSSETDPEPGEPAGGTEQKTITVTVGQTTTATISGANYEELVDKTELNESIATVEVTGTDAVAATTTYTPDSSVTCNKLISGNSDSWTAVTGYYYTPDGTNYYPLYAMRSSSWKLFQGTTYTYTWGYSTTNSTSNVTQIGTQSTTSTRTTPNITVYTKSGTDGTPASTTVTFTGVKVGTTYVTVGNTRYEIIVQDKAPDDAITSSTLSIEYRITNSTVYTSRNTSSASSATISSSDAANDEGIAIVSVVPKTAYSNYDGWIELHYWQAMRLDSEHNQSGSGSGADQTTEGITFTHVRYHNSAWQYLTSDGVWHYFQSDDQAVAYYMRHTEITTEITTAMKDWGYSTSSTTPDTSSGQGQVALTVAVVYPDGTVSPAESNMYANSTTIFNFSSNWQSSGKARDIGLIVPLNNSDYTISKITVTGGTRTDNTNSNTWTSSATIKWNKITNEADSEWYDETTYWDETMGGTPMINGATQDIRWSEKNTAKLVLIYLKPVHYDTNLIVNWVDDSASGSLISTMEVAVSSDGTPITFYNGLKQTSALPTEGVGGTFTLDDDAYVTNSSNVNQTFNKNISTVPGVADVYKTGLYQYVSAELSADGMTLTLHYNIDSSKLSKTYVVDFGLPVQIPLSNIVDNGTGENIKINRTITSYGTVEIQGNYLVYTPDKVLAGNDVVSVTAFGETIRIGFVPATTVYYEEGFASYTGSWTDTGSKGTGTQATQIAGKSTDEYGYDSKYAGESNGASNGTQVTSSNIGDTATFTFKGTGVDIYANCTEETGTVMIGVLDADRNLVKLKAVNTVMANGTTDATTGQKTDAYNVPIVSITDLAYGEYTVEIEHVKTSNANPGGNVSLDGFRVYGTLATEPDFYTTDKEDNPTFIELRDQVLAGLSVTSTGSNQTNAALPTDTTVAVVASSDKYTQDNVNDLLNNGPKNEIYLQPNQALVLKITTAREVQIGLKALNAETTYTINGEAKNITTSTDMFYTVLQKAGNENKDEQTITITNKGEGILSVTKLKVCDDPNAALGTLTEEDLTDALVSLGLQDPVEDNGSSGTETPTTPPTTDPGTETPTTPADPATGLPFTDVGPGDWFLENVKYVYEKGLMNGTGETTFSPQSTTNRAMIVTILHRLEGTPAPGAQAPFTDVPAGQYYAEAVAWAAANGIVNGTSDTTFAPLNNITREQMAAILYRYAQYKNYDVSGSADLSAFTDATSISDYAVSALQWAVEAGLINGKGNGILDPKGSATRAEVSAILSRFCENIAG